MIAPLGMAVAIMGFLVLAGKALLALGDDEVALTQAIILDITGIGLVLYAFLNLKLPGPIKRWYRILDKVYLAFLLIGMVWGFTSLISDASELSQKL